MPQHQGEITVITTLKNKTKPPHTKLAITLATLIAIALLSMIPSDTVDASHNIPGIGIDISGPLDTDSTPEGVWSDGSTIWVVDNANGKLVAYSLSDGAHLADKTIELHSSNGKPRGIWSDTATIWVSDWDDTKIYAYDLDTGNRLANKDIDLAGSNDAPRGITGQYNAILVVDKDDSYVYAYSQYDGSRRQDVEFNLHGSNDHPWGVWIGGGYAWVSDLDDNRLYAYNMYSGDHVSKRDVRLQRDNLDARGIWSDGETMWVVDKEDQYLYGIYYRHFRHTDDEIDVSAADTPRGIWTDGETMWVLDTADAHVYAYELKCSDSDYSHVQIYRKQSAEFRPSPYNNRLGPGFTGHGLRFWMTDADDDLLYAYGRPNAPAAFRTSTTELQVHHTIAGESYVGTVPAATDADGDSLTYGIGGSDVGKFTMDRETRKIYTAAGSPGFQRGDRYSLIVVVFDGKSRLDGVDYGPDDVIGITVRVLENSNPVISTPHMTLFTVDENVPGGTVIGQIDASDPDGDPLDYSVKFDGYSLHN